MVALRTAMPLLVSLSEAAFQLSLSKQDIVSLIQDGEIETVAIRGQVLVPSESLKLFTKRAKRGCAVQKESPNERAAEHGRWKEPLQLAERSKSSLNWKRT
jgi:excisionase family DNA binding protein